MGALGVMVILGFLICLHYIDKYERGCEKWSSLIIGGLFPASLIIIVVPMFFIYSLVYNYLHNS